ncbi:MAG: purine-nucleoside phosphorylase, partial [Coriobacteriia bacterium]|nr:purine-nucleoside phosphorylase [Coriobacteriia bacterium]
YLRAIGADIVGMSTVPEVIAARALGVRVLGISLVTNVAADEHISHDEVLERGRQAGEDLQRLLPAILERL